MWYAIAVICQCIDQSKWMKCGFEHTDKNYIYACMCTGAGHCSGHMYIIANHYAKLLAINLAQHLQL